VVDREQGVVVRRCQQQLDGEIDPTLAGTGAETQLRKVVGYIELAKHALTVERGNLV
jgi:hypothetical protein